MSRTESFAIVLAGGIALAGGVVALGCGGFAVEASAAKAPGGDQVAVGAKIYGRKCACCHGGSGEGSAKTPPVVGKAALPLAPPPAAKKRTMPFHTAADVLAFVKANMPGNAPGSLTDDEYDAVLAFDLKANGVDLTGKTVDMGSAAAIVLHP